VTLSPFLDAARLFHSAVLAIEIHILFKVT
jgi:hypothetical protein